MPWDGSKLELRLSSFIDCPESQRKVALSLMSRALNRHAALYK